MASRKVIKTFIGSPEEMKEYGGQVPAEYKKLEKRMSEAERASFNNVITVGTMIDVSDKRAHELEGLGILESEKKEEKKAPAKK